MKKGLDMKRLSWLHWHVNGVRTQVHSHSEVNLREEWLWLKLKVALVNLEETFKVSRDLFVQEEMIYHAVLFKLKSTLTEEEFENFKTACEGLSSIDGQ